MIMTGKSGEKKCRVCDQTSLTLSRSGYRARARLFCYIFSQTRAESAREREPFLPPMRLLYLALARAGTLTGTRFDVY